MDLFQSMKAFVAVVQTGSMSSAAEQLKVTPAMVGQYIAALEARLGTRLLNRTTRRQSLTDFGQSYLEQCQDILQRVALAETQAQAQVSEAQGTLRITAPVTFGASILSSALARYRSIAPNVTVDLTLTDTNLDLIDNRIDVAFRTGDTKDGRIIQRKLMPYKMMVCASPDYLLQRPALLHPNDLMQHDFVCFSAFSQAPIKFYRGNDLVMVTPKAAATLNNGAALLNAGIGGLGIIIQPEILVQQALSSGSLVQLLADWDLRERAVYLLYYRDQRMTPRVRSFIDFAIKTFQSY